MDRTYMAFYAVKELPIKDLGKRQRRPLEAISVIVSHLRMTT